VAASYQNQTFSDEYQLQIVLLQNQQALLSCVFGYQAQNGENSTQIQFSTTVDRIVEFYSHGDIPKHPTKDDTKLIYNGSNTVYSSYPSEGSMQWNFWVNESAVVDDVPVQIYSATTNDGVFKVRVHITPRTVESRSGVLNPNDVKMDFEIHDYPFVEDKSRLALEIEVQIQSQNSWQANLEKDGILIGEQSKWSPFGSYSWNKTAVATETDGVETLIPVIPADEPDNQGIDLYFTFLTPKGEEHGDIVWDPRLGLSYVDPTPSPSPSPQPHTPHPFCFIVCGPAAIVLVVLVILASSALIAATYVYVRNRRKRAYEQLGGPDRAL